MIRNLLSEALGAMQYNRRRTALTMLGMAWGIATVVILLAFGSGFQQAIGVIFSFDSSMPSMQLTFSATTSVPSGFLPRANTSTPQSTQS